MHPRFARWIGLFSLWTAIGLVLTLEVFFNLRVSLPTVDFWDVAASQYARVLVWAILAPWVLWLRREVPLSRGRWVGGVAFHLMLSVVVMATYYLGRIAFVVVRDGLPWADYWELARGNFFGRNLIDMVYYWAVIGCGYTFEIYRKYKNQQIVSAQLESRLMETELKALREQLNPHFLFNTMNTIAVLVREERNQEAVQLLAKLSGLLRTSLDRSRLPEVTLADEMTFIDRYIDIQQMRFADRLTVRRDVAAEALVARIPNLLLQPLVENAILHGIAPREGAGEIGISARVAEERLFLEVRDNGVGFEPATQGGRTREGIGLSNTRERLEKIYGNRSQLVLKTEPGRGTTVSLVLPFRT